MGTTWCNVCRFSQFSAGNVCRFFFVFDDVFADFRQCSPIFSQIFVRFRRYFRRFSSVFADFRPFSSIFSQIFVCVRRDFRSFSRFFVFFGPILSHDGIFYRFFWISHRFGVDFGSILEGFWEDFSMIFRIFLKNADLQNSCAHAVFRKGQALKNSIKTVKKKSIQNRCYFSMW